MGDWLLKCVGKGQIHTGCEFIRIRTPWRGIERDARDVINLDSQSHSGTTRPWDL